MPPIGPKTKAPSPTSTVRSAGAAPDPGSTRRIPLDTDHFERRPRREHPLAVWRAGLTALERQGTPDLEQVRRLQGEAAGSLGIALTAEDRRRVDMAARLAFEGRVRALESGATPADARELQALRDALRENLRGSVYAAPAGLTGGQVSDLKTRLAAHYERRLGNLERRRDGLPPLAPPPREQHDQHPLLSFAEGVFLGDASDNPSGFKTAGQVAIGAAPIAGQLADARDTLVAAKEVWDGKDGAWLNLGMAAAGWIPGAGDYLKGAARAGKDAATDLVQKGVRRQARQGGGRVVRHEAAEGAQALGAAERKAAQREGRVAGGGAGQPSPFQIADPAYLTPQSHLFTRGAAEAVREATLRDFGSAREALDFLAQRRRRIAEQMGAPDAQMFGARRAPQHGGATPMSGRYEPYNGRVPVAEGEVRAVDAELGGRRVTLTRYTRFEGRAALVHVPAQQVDEILGHVDRLYAQALDPRRSRDETVRLVGEMHWWLSHAMPYQRGSAAIADLLHHTVLAKRGFEPRGWKPGIAPDLEALVEPDVARYVERYASLMR